MTQILPYYAKRDEIGHIMIRPFDFGVQEDSNEDLHNFRIILSQRGASEKMALELKVNDMG